MNKSGLNWKIHFLSGILAVLCSFCLALSIYLLFIQTPLLSKREFAFAGLVWLLFIPLVYLCLVRFVIPVFKGYSTRGRFFLLLFSILFGLLIVSTTNQPQVFFLLPKHTLNIFVPEIPGSPAGERIVTITGLTNQYGDVSFSQFQQTGIWQRGPNSITHTGTSPASLQWEGRVGSSAQIEFENSPNSGQIQVSWDGRSSTINLEGISGETATFSKSFANDFKDNLFLNFLIWFTSSFLFLSLTLFFFTFQIKSKISSSQPKYSWLFYTLPMITVWGIYLLTFFPGMMSPDSNNQWAQAVSGQFNDAHPVFHTLLLWVLMRIWYSPASVVIFQIITLSLTTAWGISIIEEQGLPRWATWSIALLFSLAPMNGNMVVILWKDIPYSTSLFLFSLLILKVALTKGAWLNGKLSWVWLGLVSICVAGFRHNGLPIPIIMLPVLIIAYRKYWKPLLKCIAFFLIIFSLYRYPVMDLLHAERSSDNEQFLYIHHIAAHIVTGGKLTESEKQMADAILPLEDWKYACCDRLATFRSNGFSDMRIPQNASGIQALFIKLVIKEPLIEIKHILCSGSIVWEIPNRCGPNTLLPYTDVLWIDPGGAFFIENSQIPILKGTLNSVHNALSTNDGLALFISPAIYLLLSVYSTSILAARKKDLRCMLFVFPAILQSIIIFLTSPTSQFRYQFAVYLLGLFSVGLLILALITPVRISHFEDKPIIKND